MKSENGASRLKSLKVLYKFINFFQNVTTSLIIIFLLVMPVYLFWYYEMGNPYIIFGFLGTVIGYYQIVHYCNKQKNILEEDLSYLQQQYNEQGFSVRPHSLGAFSYIVPDFNKVQTEETYKVKIKHKKDFCLTLCLILLTLAASHIKIFI